MQKRWCSLGFQFARVDWISKPTPALLHSNRLLKIQELRKSEHLPKMATSGRLEVLKSSGVSDVLRAHGIAGFGKPTRIHVGLLLVPQPGTNDSTDQLPSQKQRRSRERRVGIRGRKIPGREQRSKLEDWGECISPPFCPVQDGHPNMVPRSKF